MSFPLLVEFGNEIYITPTRLKIAIRLMKQNLIHQHESNFLSRKFEIEFQNNVLSILKTKGIIVEDPLENIKLINLKDKKNNTFEFDILGYDEHTIFVVECKSFHPHPFYMLKISRERRKTNLVRFVSQFSDKIKPWLINELKKNATNGRIIIQCYQDDIHTKKGRIFQFSLPERFKNIPSEKIKAIYITQK